MRAFVGATFDGWPTLSWPSIRMVIEEGVLTLSARNVFFSIICNSNGVQRTGVSDGSPKYTLWSVALQDVSTIKRRRLRTYEIRSKNNDRVIKISFVRVAQQRAFEEALVGLVIV